MVDSQTCDKILFLAAPTVKGFPSCNPTTLHKQDLNFQRITALFWLNEAIVMTNKQ